jgi:hypothetical protein
MTPRSNAPIDRRSFFRIAVLAALCGHAAHAALAQPGAVRVVREEPVLTRTQFDPLRPPAGMPTLTPPESGVCNTTFELETRVGYSVEELAPTAVKVFVEELELVTRLNVDVYTVEGAPAKLRAHEEGHRAIGEYYYKNSAAAAEAAGRALLGASFDGIGPDRTAAEEDGFEKVLAALEQAYMARTRARSVAANARFDEITNHGLDDIDEAEALAMALAADPEPNPQ